MVGPLKVLGIDPGSRSTGWAVVTREAGRYRLIEAGSVRTDGDAPMPSRLLAIHEGLRAALLGHAPDVVAIEAIFAHRSSTSALVLGQARGVALLAAAGSGLPVFEYNASTIKRAVAGSGRADKEAVGKMVAMLLGAPVEGPHDAADAVAIAMTHLAHAPRHAALGRVAAAGAAVAAGAPPALAPSGSGARRGGAHSGPSERSARACPPPWPSCAPSPRGARRSVDAPRSTPVIARLRGTVAEIGEDRICLDVNGVGYDVQVPARTAEAARLEGALTLHVHTALREDALSLYGFASASEKEAFLLLTTVQQVGPRLALNALSALTVEALARAINGNDLKALTAISGVGRKTAERIVLELKGKLVGASPTLPAAAPRAAPDDPLPLALAQLGYKKSEIDVALARLSDLGLAEAPLDRRLAEALRIFASATRT